MLNPEERTARSHFVHHRLQPLCIAVDPEIIAVAYGVCASEERVYIIFEGGYKEIAVNDTTLREMALVVLDGIG